MAVPTDPTVTGLVTEALQKAGVDSPSAADLTRGSLWLQEILDDIWIRSFRDGNTRLKTLETELFDISTKGLRTLTLPEDFDEEISVMILDGDHRGTAQTGSSTTITLASDEDATESEVVGKRILITGGTGENSIASVTAYDTTTKIATVPSWSGTAPALSSTYLIVKDTVFLDEENIRDFDEDQVSPNIGRPSAFAKNKHQFVFDRPFDLSTYGIHVRYYMHIHQVNLTESNTATIIRILRNWRNVLMNGLAMKASEAEDDAKFQTFEARYEAQVPSLIVKEQSAGGEFTGFTL